MVIKGRGFDADAEDNEVYFANQPALILAASETELTVVAPSAASADFQVTTQVHVKANGAISSSPVMFTHLRQSATTFPLRFYAASVLAHPQFAFVSTDLGPVLVLGGGETDVEATAARAVQVAATLNKLAAEAASAHLVFEVRQQPETAVAVQGREAPIVRPPRRTPSPTSCPSSRGSRRSDLPCAAWPPIGRPSSRTTSPCSWRSSARWRCSPCRPAAGSSPRSTRPRSGSPARPGCRSPWSARSVPPWPRPSASWPSSCPRTRSRGSRWRWRASGRGPWKRPRGRKAIEVLFEQKGGRLAGTLTTSAGKVALKTPMREVSFQKNEVRFTVDISGSARVFTGTVQGGSLAGTIARGSDKAAGRFSLKYVE